MVSTYGCNIKSVQGAGLHIALGILPLSWQALYSLDSSNALFACGGSGWRYSRLPCLRLSGTSSFPCIDMLHDMKSSDILCKWIEADMLCAGMLPYM